LYDDGGKGLPSRRMTRLQVPLPLILKLLPISL